MRTADPYRVTPLTGVAQQTLSSIRSQRRDSGWNPIGSASKLNYDPSRSIKVTTHLPTDTSILFLHQGPLSPRSSKRQNKTRRHECRQGEIGHAANIRVSALAEIANHVWTSKATKISNGVNQAN